MEKEKECEGTEGTEDMCDEGTEKGSKGREPEDPAGVSTSAGSKIYAGNKLFWRNSHTVHTTMWLNEEVRCVSVVCWNETVDRHFPPIFVDAGKVPGGVRGVGTTEKERRKVRTGMRA